MRQSAVLAWVMMAWVASTSQAQNPIQWQGNPKAAVEHAREQNLPLMVWVWENTQEGLGARQSAGDDLRDAQEDAFRDPAVVSIAHSRYVPLRLMRNSKSKEILEELGLPTEYGLYIALVTPDRQLLDKIGIEEVADPRRLASRLEAASRTYVDNIYKRELKPVISDPNAKKADVRRAVQTTWRLKIMSADRDIVALLKREDLTASERRRLYALLASMGTTACVTALLDASATDKDAGAALLRAHASALEPLLIEMPTCDGGAPTARQLTAYRALVNVARAGQPRPDAYWTDTPKEKCEAELARLRERAEAVLGYARSNEGGAD